MRSIRDGEYLTLRVILVVLLYTLERNRSTQLPLIDIQHISYSATITHIYSGNESNPIVSIKCSVVSKIPEKEARIIKCVFR